MMNGFEDIDYGEYFNISRDTDEVEGGGWTGTRRQSVNYRRLRSSAYSLRRPRSLT